MKTEKGLSKEIYRSDIKDMVDTIQEKQVLRYLWIVIDDVCTDLGLKPRLECVFKEQEPEQIADTDYEFISESYNMTTWKEDAIKAIMKLKTLEDQRFVCNVAEAAVRQEQVEQGLEQNS